MIRMHRSDCGGFSSYPHFHWRQEQRHHQSPRTSLPAAGIVRPTSASPGAASFGLKFVVAILISLVCIGVLALHYHP
jgi:hypothetical protein